MLRKYADLIFDLTTPRKCFNYMMSQASFIKSFTVFPNIITVYMHESANCELSELEDLTQNNTQCPGEKFSFIENNDLVHQVVSPHITASEMGTPHKHLMACSYITPNDLANFLKQLLQIQKKLSGSLVPGPNVVKVINEDTGQVNLVPWKAGNTVTLNGGSKIRVIMPNTAAELISRQDAHEFLRTYREYYHDHETSLPRQYAKETTLVEIAELQSKAIEVGADLSFTALQSAGLTTILSSLRAFMQHQGCNKKFADITLDLLLAAYLVMNTEKFTPFMMPTLISIISSLTENKNLHAIKNPLLIGMYFIGGGMPTSLYEASKMSLSIAASYVANQTVKWFTPKLFGPANMLPAKLTSPQGNAHRGLSKL